MEFVTMGSASRPSSAERRLGGTAMVRASERASLQTVQGRDPELTALGQHLDHLLSGVGAVILVEGGAGMGKSRLRREAAAMARRLWIRVGGGVADPGDTIIPLAVLMEALFEGPAPILERTALGDAHASAEQRNCRLQDLEALLETAAIKGPLLVCLDDVKWGDSGTAAALRPCRFAWPRYRSLGDRASAWTRILQVRGAVDFLGGSGRGNRAGSAGAGRVAQMAADVLGAEPDRELLKMSERPAGNPFLLVELLSGLREEGLVRIESGRAELVEWRLPHRVSHSMRLRLERMPTVDASGGYGRGHAGTEVFPR